MQTQGCISLVCLVRHLGEVIPPIWCAHVTPVMLDKDENGYLNVFIMDSNGVERTHSDPLIEDVDTFSFGLARSVLKGAESDSNKLAFYALAKRRQYDFSSCPAISIFDALCMVGSTARIKDHILSQPLTTLKSGLVKYERLTLKCFDTPLPDMIKSTQSISRFKELIARAPFDSIESVDTFAHNNFREVRQYNGELLAINQFIANQYIDFERFLISSVLNEVRLHENSMTAHH